MNRVTITRDELGLHGEYHAHVPGNDRIGRLMWVRRGDVRVAEHTIVPPELSGKGIAGKLVEALVADAREHGFKIVPECSFVAEAFSRHPEWSDLLA